MHTTLSLDPAVLDVFLGQRDWARGRCLVIARGAGRTGELADDLAEDLLAEVTESFLGVPGWFTGDSVCLEARVRHRLVLLVRQRATALYRAESRTRFRLMITDEVADPADAVDEVLARRAVVAEAPGWIRGALGGNPRRLLAVLAVHLPDQVRASDFGLAPPLRGAEEGWALFGDFAGMASDRAGWKAIVAEILRGAGPIGSAPSREVQKMVNALEHKLARSYADIAVHLSGCEWF